MARINAQFLGRTSKRQSKKFGTNVSAHCFSFARLGIEHLESRCMLTAAIGTFEELATQAYTDIELYAIAGSEVDIFTRVIEVDEHAATTQGNALAQNEAGYAYVSGLVSAKSPIDVVNPLSLPIIGASLGKRVIVSGNAVGFFGGQSNSTIDASAWAVYKYHAPAGYSGDLEFHGHIFVSVNGFEEAGPAVEYHTGYSVGGGIDGFGAGAIHESSHSNPNETWWFGSDLPIPDGFEDYIEGGFFYHTEFVKPIIDGEEIDFFSDSFAGIDADANGDSASLGWHVGSWLWGYVTPAGTDLTPGDFNGDGAVDRDDYLLWRDGDPRADAVTPFDGIIDEDDWDIWAQNNTGAIIVSTDTDIVDGNYASGELSFREAIALAADENHPGTDDIVFAPSVTQILLGGTQLAIASGNNVKIIGPGADMLTIDAQDDSRVFSIESGVTATISGLTITGGNSASGGGVHNAGNLTFNSVVIEGNTGTNGGGVYNNAGQLRISDSTVSQNTATTGGGVYTNSNMTDALVVESSAFIDNTATSSGALHLNGSDAEAGTATIVNSTFSGNSATTGEGGAIRNSSGAPPLTIMNSTIASNTAASYGGGLSMHSVSENRFTLHNTIVANNNSSGTTAENIYRNVTSGSSYNLIGTGGTGGLVNGSQGNQVGVSDVGLAPLGNYGGPTETHALLADSPAIDKGSNSLAAGLLYDQRGPYFDRIVNGGIGAIVDVGAFEYPPEVEGGAGGGSAFIAAAAQAEEQHFIAPALEKTSDAEFTADVFDASIPMSWILDHRKHESPIARDGIWAELGQDKFSKSTSLHLLAALTVPNDLGVSDGSSSDPDAKFADERDEFEFSSDKYSEFEALELALAELLG